MHFYSKTIVIQKKTENAVRVNMKRGWIMYTSLEPEPLRVGDGDRQLPLQLVLVLVVRQNNLGRKSK